MKKIKTNNIIIVALICLLSFTYAGCKKDDKEKRSDGIVLDLGNPAADGCGWVIRINHVDFTPKNLDESFKKDSLPVKLTYEVLETRFTCGLAANIGFSYINVKSISKR